MDKRFKPFSDKSMMIGQTLYRLNGNPCYNGNGVSKNGVYEPFSYRFKMFSLTKKKKNRRCHCSKNVQPSKMIIDLGFASVDIHFVRVNILTITISGMTTVKLAQGSRFMVQGSRFTIRRSWFTVRIRSSRFTVHDSRSTIRSLRFSIHG